MSAVACINKMGTSHSAQCNSVTREIWEFCNSRSIWISAVYVPGKENLDADEEYRRGNLDAEWMLNSDILNDAMGILGVTPCIDLIASRLNNQFAKYASFRLT